MRGFLTAYVRGKQRTLKYEFAVLVLGAWLIFTVRLLISGDPVWITAQAGNYSTITWGALAFVAAAVGLQTWQNQQSGGAGVGLAPAGDDDAPMPRPTEETLRSAG